MAEQKLPEPRYIGDGVYVSFDGYQWWLKTQRYDTEDKIALEPDVIAALMRYIEDTKNFYSKGSANADD